ncbi:hypothetical protein LJ737_24710 [Hymenobacter sp. 15J16-1T3B]|uniref:DUF3108 domain-containing protein n=1 Tax=Hymenobacter sp. 15J16-1T3B TaxID=2886941 RepID=UPI001D12D6D4|nr:hypothetical protein [Hymenobacter sp. 15J16-1T3B]MCC3160462.1 hypothetical protein [Hymenobacter sp. 15J16-1T3B]
MKRFLTAWALALLPLVGFSQSAPDTIRTFLAKQLRKLRPGMRQYLVFMQRGNRPQANNSALWLRHVAIDANRREVVISQQWFSGDSTTNRQLLSRNRLDNFRPVYHRTSSRRAGVAAFNFLGDNIVGTDSVAGNRQAALVVPTPAPTLNWELDLETFELLDYAPGKKFVLNFYHPGGPVLPKWYTYEVVGKETIPLIGAATAECWKLRINYDAQNYAVFWIATKTNEVLKMEEEYNGVRRYKVKLATPAVPAAARKPLS